MMTATIPPSLQQNASRVDALFDTYDELFNGRSLKWVIEGLAHEESINIIAGLSGHGKTWIAMSITKALLEGGKLWGTFIIPEPAEKVVYLVPEVGRCSFSKRLKLFQLERYVKEGRLLIRTLSKGPAPSLVDKELLQAAKGAHAFLDTAVRFMQGDENMSSDNRALANASFRLLECGARTLWPIHHSPKSFEIATSMTLENVLRGSSDIGAMASNVYGVKQLLPDTNLIHVECVKGRDLDEPVQPFQIEGRPWIDREGNFRMVNPPGECESLWDETSRLAGRNRDRMEFAKKLWEQQAGRNEIMRQVREKFGKCSGHTVTNWVKQWSKAKQ